MDALGARPRHSHSAVGRGGVAQRIARLLAASLLIFLVQPIAPSHADGNDWGLNGTFRAQSNGEWAQTNDSYRDEQTVIATWTVSTTCTTRFDCVGDVASNQGWTAPLYTKSGTFYVKHIVPQWEPCPDGSRSDGLQVFHFYPARPDGNGDMTSTELFMGEDTTTGISGACGISKPLVVKIPFKLAKVG
ncbi:hypothetical protein [Mycobacterium sp. DL440]|uniref:hypothetical protein n=1 Tax=Mycobacterium sp. DL440 TaxID=2675523 RepID=UPI001FB8CAD9|nr:hypothetical protein [Mycobacterium sp. DL440]